MIKREKENRILKEIYKRERLSVKDLINFPELPKNSIYKHIKELTYQKLIIRISENPIVVKFPLNTILFLMEIKKEKLMLLNDIKTFINRNNLNNTDILERFIDAGIITVSTKDKNVYISLIEKTLG